MLGALGSLMFMLVVNFFLFRVLPGDPARTLGRGRLSTQEQLDEFNRTYGLDQPLGAAVRDVPARTRFTGELGLLAPLPQRRSPRSWLDRLWPTLLLVGTSTILAALIGVWLGIRAGVEPRQHVRQGSRPAASLTLYSMPEWWLGLLLIAAFAVGIGPAARASSRPAGCTRPTSTRRRSRASSTRPGTWPCRC